MCFRPAEADAGLKPVACPSCGKRVFPTQGELPSKCPFCKESLADAKPISMAAPGTVAAPGAPAAPAASGAPKAPGAPIAPK